MIRVDRARMSRLMACRMRPTVDGFGWGSAASTTAPRYRRRRAASTSGRPGRWCAGHPDPHERAVGQRRVAAFVISAQARSYTVALEMPIAPHMRRRPTSGDTFNDQTTSENIDTGVTSRNRTSSG